MMSFKTINHYAEGRVFEWCMGVAMLAVGIEALIWPSTSKADGLLLSILSPISITLIMLALGWARCAALMLNGQIMFHYELGPWVRAFCGIFSAPIWAQFVMELVQTSIVRGYPSPGIPFWFMFTIGELYTAYTTVKNRND